MFEKEAEQRIHLGLLIDKAMTEYKITATREQVMARLNELAANYEDPQEVINMYYSNKQALQEIEATIMEEQVMLKLIEQAIVNEVPSTYWKVMKQEVTE